MCMPCNSEGKSFIMYAVVLVRFVVYAVMLIHVFTLPCFQPSLQELRTRAAPAPQTLQITIITPFRRRSALRLRGNQPQPRACPSSEPISSAHTPLGAAGGHPRRPSAPLSPGGAPQRPPRPARRAAGKEGRAVLPSPKMAAEGRRPEGRSGAERSGAGCGAAPRRLRGSRPLLPASPPWRPAGWRWAR